MNIFVDESGTFGPAPARDSWCVVVAYVSPEIDRAPLERLVGALRRECSDGREVKLPDIPEERYAVFLRDLAKLRGVAFAVAVDAGAHTKEDLVQHRDAQADKVVEHIDKMLYEGGRQGLRDLAAAIRDLPVQLYTQLITQVELFHDVVVLGITYYAQRIPATLGTLRWRVDQKDTIPTAYEKAFRTILPALLQTKSERDPMLMLKDGADYRFFDRKYLFPPGEAPTYLRDVYGLDYQPEGDAVDVGKIVRDNFQLVDSRKVTGVQVADLLASGLRRTLRGNFDRPGRIALCLGSNMLQRAYEAPPVRLIGVGPGDTHVSRRAADLLRTMARVSRPYLSSTALRAE